MPTNRNTTTTGAAQRVAAIVFSIFCNLCTIFSAQPAHAQKNHTLLSPNKDLRVVFSPSPNDYTYQVYYKEISILAPCIIDMLLSNGTQLSDAKKIQSVTRKQNRSVIISPVPEKRKIIPDEFNEMIIHVDRSFSISFRAYNDGVAYRIHTNFPDSIIITNELAGFSFPSSHPVHFSEVQPGRQDIYHTSFEETYELMPLDSIRKESLLFNPLVVAPHEGPRIAVTESDVEDYPGMFLRKTSDKRLSAEFAPYPAAEELAPGEFPQLTVTRRADFIAHTKGARAYPWRVLMIASTDKDLPSNDLVYRLASPSRLKDHSWIKPAQSTDEWIISANLFHVDFKAGVNTATYKYYIDFAKRFGIESVMMDAGWSNNSDLFDINPDIDMEEILTHAKTQGIRINMWTLAHTLEKQLEPALEQFNKWGVNFIMTDFFDRDDQKSMNRMVRIAEACAAHKIMIMFHGAPKPAGFNRTYPHAIAREGVLGSEFNIWSDRATPRHNVTLPFTRMLAGPMDYEPGLLDNAHAKAFRPIEGHVMSMGTRTNQLAMYVVYESPIQFFSGNPSQGMFEPAFMELLGSIPTVWDTTIVVDGKIANYIITARKKDGNWYLGAMTDSSVRTFNIPLDFLGAGEYEATLCEDGVNADRYASDYRIHSKTVSRDDKLFFRMQAGGGFMARFVKKD